MLQITKTTNLNGTSRIEDSNGNSVVVASMFAAIQSDGQFSVSKSITNGPLYFINKSLVDADYKEFETAATQILEAEVADDDN